MISVAGVIQRMSMLAPNRWHIIYIVALLCGLRYGVKHVLSTRARLPLPPGPPGHWLFGNRLPTSR